MLSHGVISGIWLTWPLSALASHAGITALPVGEGPKDNSQDDSPSDCWAGPLEYSRCFGPSFAGGGNPKCWESGNLTYEHCCNPYFGAPGNGNCWDAIRTYGRCCGATTKSVENMQAMDDIRQKYEAWTGTPSFRNLQTLWLGIGKRSGSLFATRRIHVPGLIPAFNYMFPAGDFDNMHLLYDEKGHFVALEPRVTYQAARHLRSCCAAKRSKRGHFLDVGGNFGWYALLAAALGCEVDVLEPVPWFAALMNYTRNELNDQTLAQRVRLHTGRIIGGSGSHKEKRTLAVPIAGVLGEGGVDGATKYGIGRCGKEVLCLDMEVISIDDLQLDPSSQGWRSCGMKVDVEGFEHEVFEGARRFISMERPKVIVTETFDPTGTKLQEMLEHLQMMGYVAHVLRWNLIKNPTWAVARRDVDNSTAVGSCMELLRQCGEPCMIFYTRN